jgi:uncharacterized BrkB/YihY/UPF0761 family membrane protein
LEHWQASESKATWKLWGKRLLGIMATLAVGVGCIFTIVIMLQYSTKIEHMVESLHPSLTSVSTFVIPVNKNLILYSFFFLLCQIKIEIKY